MSGKYEKIIFDPWATKKKSQQKLKKLKIMKLCHNNLRDTAKAVLTEKFIAYIHLLQNERLKICTVNYKQKFKIKYRTNSEIFKKERIQTRNRKQRTIKEEKPIEKITQIVKNKSEKTLKKYSKEEVVTPRLINNTLVLLKLYINQLKPKGNGYIERKKWQNSCKDWKTQLDL